MTYSSSFFCRAIDKHMSDHFAEDRFKLMSRSLIAVAIFALQLTFSASAERIKRQPPNEKETARAASEQAMNDGNLQKGDIVSTDHGFFEFRGVMQDGRFDFVLIPNPVGAPKTGGAPPR
jgi:hypothetical protein